MNLPDTLWPLAALLVLGAFHGLNPAMGWLFAVAIGFQERSGRSVVAALGPIALGHALAIACVAVPVGLLQVVVPHGPMMVLSGIVLIGYAGWKVATRFRHPRWVGMRVKGRELVAWSALMAAAHGAGVMLIPAISGLTSGDQASAEASGGHLGHAHHARVAEPGVSLLSAMLAVSLHTAAMLVAMGMAGLVVYYWIGVDVLRKAWINFDLVWVGTMGLTGAFSVMIGIWALAA
ncbi:MAG: hypothetical protein IT335_07135 [Thermomicrobiales bacterium]|nr:hypothetical protein [Thermomicrobiales bacterium]